MREACDGREVVGMDLHRRRSVLVRMTGDGQKIETARITSSPAELRRQIARAGTHPRVVLEATYGWYWAAGTLAAAGAEVHLAHPLGVKGFAYRRVKNDGRDAADLADLLRMGRLPEAWVAPHQVRELRELTRYRVKLVRIRTSCKDQVHAILAKLGVPVTCSDIFGVWGSTWLDGLALPQPYSGKMASLRKICAVLAGEIALLEAAIAGLLEDRQGYRAVRALPGVGPVLGAVIVAEIGDITRFPRPAELCSWAGLTPRHRESDVKVSRGHITKQGSRILRWALIEAIQHVPAGHPLRQRKEDIIYPPRRPGTQHRQGRHGPPAAHLGLLRHARRAGPIPGHRSAAGWVSRPGRGQRVIAGFTGPRPPAARPPV